MGWRASIGKVLKATDAFIVVSRHARSCKVGATQYVPGIHHKYNTITHSNNDQAYGNTKA